MAARTIPTLPTWTAGMRVTGANLAAMVSYQQFWADPPMFRMYQAVAQSINNSTYTQITCDTSEYDTESGRSGSSPYSYTIPTGGRWQFTGMISWSGNATGVRIAALFKNGSQINGANCSEQAAPAANATNVIVSATVAVTAGDVIGLYGWQSSGGALNTQVGNSFPPFFEGRLISLASP